MEFHRSQSGAALGSTARFREESREVWIPAFVDGLAKDARQAWRGLRRSPVFAVTAIGTLALALGFGAAIVSLASAVLFRPLPFREADRQVLVFEGTSRETAQADTSPGTYRDLARSMKTLEGLALFGSIEANLTGDHEPERVDGGVVTPNFFHTVGVTPQLGRFFAESEGEPGKDQVVVLSHELWQRRYGGDRGVIGREVRLNERPYRVIGVLPPGFRYCLQRPEIWRTFAVTPQRWASRGARYIWVTGRLAKGATLAQVQTELDVFAAQHRKDFPRENGRLHLGAVPLRERLTLNVRSSLYFLLAAVAALLLIACSNVANLLLTRSVVRGAEFEVRRALGASGWRIGQQLLVESLVLASCAAALAVPVMLGALKVLEALVPAGMAAYTRLEVDWVTVAALVALAFAAALLSGLLPALRSGQPLNTRAIGGAGQDQLRGALIVAEVALAILLMSGASLLFRTFLNLQNVDSGFVAQGVTSAQTWLPPQLMENPARRTEFYQQVLTRVRAIPGVRHAAYGSAVPLTWKGGSSSFQVEGRPSEPGVNIAVMRQATAGYFETLRIRLRAGRYLGAEDRAGSEKVTVVNATLAQRMWPGESAIGKRLRRGDGSGDWIRVVGVVDDVLELGLDAPAPMITYFPETQQPASTFSVPLYVMARADRPVAAELRQAILAVNPQQTVAKLQPVETVLQEELAERRVRSVISVAFAVLALALACFGIHGSLSYAVASRGREFGVRVALGASRGSLIGMVLGQGLRLSLVGVAIGLAAAWGLTRFMRTLLFGVQPDDPWVLTGVAALLVATAALASWGPARRACRVDPAQALRGE